MTEKGTTLEVPSKPALVLDLDETLIRATRIKTKAQDAKRIVVKKKSFYVQMRPGLSEFLNSMKELFEIYFFTSSDKEYADLVINCVAPFVPRSHCFYGDSVTHDSGVDVKDLTLIGKPLAKVIMIDNSPSSGLYQPQNVIVIDSWFGDSCDFALINELEPLLKEAACESNIPIGASKAMDAQKPKSIALLTSL